MGKFCPNCGNQMSDSAKFCIECGTKIEDYTAQTFKSAPTSTPTPILTPIPQKTIINSIGMEFVLIPAGEFDMGSPSNEKDRDTNEGPVHRVKISNAFYMGKYQATQKQWREVMGNNSSYFKGDYCDYLPVENVSWDDVQEYIKKLNKSEGIDKYRLPSEAEWEYAARAGTTSRYSFGDDESKLVNYAWYGTNSGMRTNVVGMLMPNPWGLYDIHGNVWEWVQDMYHDNYNGAPKDGSVWKYSIWKAGDYGHIKRGGGWMNYAKFCRSASRGASIPRCRYNNVGFRLLRDL